MQNRTFLELLRPIFAQKMKTDPPKGIWVEGVAVIRPKNPSQFRKTVRISEKYVSILVKTFFCFGPKNRLNFRKIRLNFGEDLFFSFFFLEITCFWAEKPFEFPIPAKKFVFFLWRSLAFGPKNRSKFLILAEKHV